MGGPAWSLLPLLFLLLLLLPGAHGDCLSPPATVQISDPKDSYPVGTTLRYKCIPGYQYIYGSSPNIRCLDSSEWSPTFCEEKNCRPPVVENGGIRDTDGLRLGKNITYICDPGYKPQGSTTARCVVSGDGVQWDTSPPLCDRIQCERPLSIVHGRHSGDEYADVYTVGIVVTYTCDRDFSLIGNASITCVTAEDNENGMWDKSAPECKVVQCERPNIPNGRLTSAFQPTYTYNHRLQLVCNNGYTLMGNEFVTCNADSKWEPKLPECRIVKPGKPTIRPGPISTTTTTTTTETVTKDIESTQRPDIPPEDKPGGNTIVGIVIGVFAAVVLVAVGFVLYIKQLLCFKKGKSDSRPSPSKPYHPVLGKEVEMEVK